MKKRSLIRGERHHWWPQGLSQHWTNENGLIHRVDTHGVISKAKPRKLGRISGGHNITFNETSPWEHTFEQLFDRPDGNFPSVVEWLNDLMENHPPNKDAQRTSFSFPHSCDDKRLQRLFECLMSLTVRSPMFRDGSVRFAEQLRGPIEKTEQKRLAAANLRQSYSLLTEGLSTPGKFVVYFSESREFIFGDGFYSNLTVVSQDAFDAMILVPLTPNLAVLFVHPIQYKSEPRLITRRAGPDLVALINKTVQIYSKECLFFRSTRPTLSEDFILGEHRTYGQNDPIEALVASIP